MDPNYTILAPPACALAEASAQERDPDRQLACNAASTHPPPPAHYTQVQPDPVAGYLVNETLVQSTAPTLVLDQQLAYNPAFVQGSAPPLTPAVNAGSSPPMWVDYGHAQGPPMPYGIPILQGPAMAAPPNQQATQHGWSAPAQTYGPGPHGPGGYPMPPGPHGPPMQPRPYGTPMPPGPYGPPMPSGAHGPPIPPGLPVPAIPPAPYGTTQVQPAPLVSNEALTTALTARAALKAKERTEKRIRKVAGGIIGLILFIVIIVIMVQVTND